MTSGPTTGGCGPCSAACRPASRCWPRPRPRTRGGPVTLPSNSAPAARARRSCSGVRWTGIRSGWPWSRCPPRTSGWAGAPPPPPQRRARLAARLAELPGSGIIYTLTVAATQETAAFLREQGMTVTAYSGRDEQADRLKAEDDLLANRVKALVATSALGRGFDKPDLGF